MGGWREGTGKEGKRLRNKGKEWERERRTVEESGRQEKNTLKRLETKRRWEGEGKKRDKEENAEKEMKECERKRKGEP